MRTYTMIMQTTTGGLSWGYEFEVASDDMAIEYAKRHIPQLAQIPWFMSLVVFDVQDDRKIVSLRARTTIEVILF